MNINLQLIQHWPIAIYKYSVKMNAKKKLATDYKQYYYLNLRIELSNN